MSGAFLVIGELTDEAPLGHIICHLSHDGLVLFKETIPLILLPFLDSVLEFANLHLPLILHLLPVNAGAEDGLLRRVARHHILSFVNHLVLVELLHLTPDIELKHCLMILEPAVFHAGDIEAWQGHDARNDRAAGDEDAELPRFLLRVETVVVLQRDVEVRGDHAEDRDQEEEHRNGSASDGGVANGREDADGGLAPAGGQQVLDEEAGHAHPEVVVAEVDHQAARDGDERGYDANVGLGHVVDVVVSIRNNGSSEGADEAAGKAADGGPEGELLLVASVHLEVLAVEEAHGDALLGSEASGEQDPKSTIVHEDLPHGLEVVVEPVVVLILRFLLDVESPPRHGIFRELVGSIGLGAGLDGGVVGVDEDALCDVEAAALGLVEGDQGDGEDDEADEGHKLESGSPAEPLDEVDVDGAEWATKLHAESVQGVRKGPVLRRDPIRDQRIGARSREGREEGLDHPECVELPEGGREAAQVSAEAPAKASPAKEHLPVVEIGQRAREQDHEGVDDCKSITSHRLVVLRGEIWYVETDTVVWIVC